MEREDYHTDYTPQHYNHLAHSAKDAALAEYKRWVEAHSVEEIKAANTVRRILRMREGLPKQGKSKWLNIKDERQTARPMSAFLFFVVARHASGDFKGIIPSDRTKLIAQEWKALSEEEKSVRKTGETTIEEIDHFADSF
jgi:hypothetical protein